MTGVAYVSVLQADPATDEVYARLALVAEGEVRIDAAPSSRFAGFMFVPP